MREVHKGHAGGWAGGPYPPHLLTGHLLCRMEEALSPRAVMLILPADTMCLARDA